MKTKLLKIACSAVMVNASLYGQEILSSPENSEELVANRSSRSKQMSEPCLQGEMLTPCCKYPAALNAPSTIAVEPWENNLFFGASYTYWQVGEDGLTLANSVLADLAANNSQLPFNSTVLTQNQDFSSGYKMELGLTIDQEWTLASQYSWVRRTNITNVGSPNEPSIAGLTPVWNVTDWFVQLTTNNPSTIVAQNVRSKWKIGMDLLDIVASRPYYQGAMLAVSPFIGLKAAWIRQTLSMSVDVPSGFVASQAPNPIKSVNKSHSWGLGPRFGLNSYCLLPMGFRLEGDCAASLLFTQYTKISHDEKNISNTINFGQNGTNAHYPDYNCVRPIAEAALGFGWGRYISCKHQYHIDFSATYECAVYWQQNMIRVLLDESWALVNHAAGNLYTQGLTLNGRFDF